ncbi:TetR/AcrR family transcriptional regulator [Dactylosporangium sp. CS-033363]|uniref:TetR/AcrR family transcriptional regulator n=1 Tax=Dactylosporangium sp. CS-033363 TaxID=3239935 RepID=UPI003D90D02F
MHDDEGLRERLVRAGAELVAEEGSAAVSLREIARRAGVSHGAPRRYFPTHVELLSAIARVGFADLTTRLRGEGEPPARRRTAGEDGSARDRLAVLARAYVAFAQEHRGMYELMFRHDLLRSDRLGLRETSLPLFETLAHLLAEARGEHTPAVTAAGAFWANLHGIVQLWLWGSLPLATGQDDIGALVDAALDAHTTRRDA